ncbi:flagellar basal-body MS-ring/collar protein FliF [Desulfitobacterium metallireducens]|uniref:Flagellar M-ring protein n=1 Tax=Desulfitobacterium metallireducens DSM 15288 TaxID=871968 RepID=W0EF26_9FIRM|nr:flagellar basal-body MS-ring/collar protein FliF [Desulfitobacterium metallireducens]AHF07789.1 flagellar M-ring protein FliF [Desulfitobacterium metallireducens DSM 15288]
MNFSWAGIQQSIREFWGKLSRPQKIITVIAPLIVTVALVSLILWAGRPQYVALFSNLADTDAGAITTKLKDLKVNYQLANNGTTIMVPQSQASEVRLELANAGLPQGSKFSFDYLNSVRLGETDADRKIRYVLGLQTELETTLKTLAGVEDARVHIVMPDPSLFADKEKPATAAVTLKVATGTEIADEQVKAIANLLRGSVEGLQPENVTIVDTKGNTLSDVLSSESDPKKLTVTQLQLQQKVETDLQKSLQSMLDRVFGTGKTVVRANAVLNFDQVSINSTKNGPGAVVSEKNSTENTANNAQGGATPGVTPNVAPGYVGTTANGSTSTSAKTDSTRNYQVDSTQEQRVVAPGSVKRLSVSIMADSDVVTNAQLAQIQTVVASASGIDLTRGDQIEVAALPFDKTGIDQEQQQRDAAARNQQLLRYVELGIGALLALVFIFLVLRMRSKRKAEAGGFDLSGELQPVPLAAAEELLLAQQQAQQQAEREADLKLAQKKKKSAEEIEKQKVKEAVELYAENNPDDVAKLVKTWLAEEK